MPQLIWTIHQDPERSLYLSFLTDMERGETLSFQQPYEPAQRGEFLHWLRTINTPEFSGPTLSEQGQFLSRHFLGPELTSLLFSPLTEKGVLLIQTNDLALPWELAHDGDRFLWQQWALGMRAIRPAGAEVPWGPGAFVSRQVSDTLEVLLVNDPRDDLPRTRREGQYLHRLLNSQALLRCECLEGPQATKEAVLRALRTGRFQLVHFNGHGGYADADPGRSAVFLAGEEVLCAADILALEEAVRPQVVVVNACESAVAGDPSQGGLAAAFLERGLRAYLGTRWPVDEHVAGRLMADFYFGLAQGLAIGEALQRAKQTAYRQNRADPTWSWGAFVMYGSPAYIPFRRQAFTSSAVPTSPLVEREKECALLRAQFEQVAQERRGRLVLIEGEEGVGKTRLASELIPLVVGQGGCFLAGNCDEPAQRGEVPERAYQPWVRALEEYFRHVTEETYARQLVGPFEAELAVCVPGLRDRLDHPVPGEPTPGESSPLRLFEAVTRVLCEIARFQVVVVLLDDLQWASSSTLELLRYVVRNTAQAAVLLCGAYRPNPTHEALAGFLTEARSLPRIVLEPLSLPATQHLLAEWLPQAQVGTEVAGRLHQQTGGNPRFLEDLVPYLRDTGVLVPQQGQWQLTADVQTLPPSLHEFWARRLRGLKPEQRTVLAAAAVFGEEWTVPTLSHVLDCPEAEVIGKVEDLLNEPLLRERTTAHERRLTLIHPLLGLLLAQDLAKEPDRYRTLHSRVAHVWAAERVSEERSGAIADHYEAAADWSNSLRYRLQAAARAAALYAPEEAFHHYQKALDIYEQADPSVRPSRAFLYRQQAAALRDLGPARYEESLQRLRQAEQALAAAEDPAEESEICYLRAWILNQQRNAEEALRQAQRGLQQARAASQPRLLAQAHRVLGQIEERRGNLDSALAHQQESLALARQIGDPVAEGKAANDRGSVQLRQGDYAAARESFTLAVARFRDRGDLEEEARAAYNRSLALQAAGEIPAALQSLQRSGSLAERLGDPSLRAAVHLSQGLLHAAQGQLDEAVEAYQHSLQVSRELQQPDREARAHLYLGEVFFQQAAYPAALRHYHRARELSLEEPGRVWADLGLAATYCEMGQAGLASEQAEQSLRAAQGLGGAATELLIQALNHVGYALLKQGRIDEAEPFLREALARCQEAGGQRFQPQVANSLAELEGARGQWDAAEAHARAARLGALQVRDRKEEAVALRLWAQALRAQGAAAEARLCAAESVALLAETGWRHEEARARLEQARGEQAQGNRDAARSLAEEARAAFREIGAMGDEAEAAVFLGEGARG